MDTYDALPKVYDPKAVEPKWYEYWLKQGYFHAEVDPSREMYCITIPPPNITGSLHIGHALCYTIQDVLGRWKRMQGFNTLILPGTDHAGIATQNVVERELAKEGLTRHDLGREKFLERVWQWKEEYGSTIISQFKRMGYAFDWDRLRFTMDEAYSDAVLEEFVRWFDEGHIYRGVRVINWCTRCHTAVSDIEVEYEEVAGHLWHIDYPLEDGSGIITVATTRPETMLGDTAVAVNPEDRRYMGVVGKNAVLPLMDRSIPIITDPHVDPDFGTGAVKVTPAHDPNDFEIGLRHNLPSVIVIGPEGKMTDEAGRFAGMDRYAAREAIVEELRSQGLLVHEEEYMHSVGTCERCGSTIEPLLSEQWFARMEEIAQPAIDIVREGKVKFIPDRYARIYLDWMENIRDWCISRQLWWGHRIPVWKCEGCGEYTAGKTAPDACSKCGGKALTQDPDVLDTWFSSALWPFATLGWPKDTPELHYFYPTSVLTTAREIIYLWVARMIMTSLHFLNEIPFHEVYIYATVLNEEGRRMSKSLGTGMDPLDIIDKYGADALRFALIQQAGKGQDIRFSAGRVEAIRNFCNKIWNMSRFVLLNLDTESGKPPEAPSRDRLRDEDKWILSRLQKTIAAVSKGLEGYDMDDAARALYDFLWSEYADWYIEIAKPRLQGDERPVVQYVLCHVLESSLRLLHPIMPFITEQIWQSIPHEGESIMIAPFPAADATLIDNDAEQRMEAVFADITRSIRNVKAEFGFKPGQRTSRVMIVPKLNPIVSKEMVTGTVAASGIVMATLAGVKSIESREEAPSASEGRFIPTHLPVADVFVETGQDLDIHKEIARVTNELAEVERELARSQAKLSNEQFLSRAPAHVVEKEQRIAQELSEKRSKLQERLEMLTNS
ncbi:MAG TPA: valine--tRNA ligase [Armatimonadota bacterium]|nr:valine--tRNA ligase [Armatimonadota bacterium]